MSSSPHRIIRTVAFMLTVLPSQRPGCFARRFPPVPSSWWRFLVIGFTKLRAMGGWCARPSSLLCAVFCDLPC